MLDVQGLRKSFGDHAAVDGVSFRVEAGEIYGLLGPNGAGKTTTISMICGLLAPDSGHVRIGGADLRADLRGARGKMGFVPQETALYEELTARENLRFWGELYGLRGKPLFSRIGDVLERVGLKDRAKDAVRSFSGGMKRRVNLAAALLHRPKLLLLDEPTVGIDPQARLNILDIVRETAREGAAVLYTTHYMEEAEQLCLRIGIMDHGRLIAEGALSELVKRVGEGRLITIRGRFTADQIHGLLKGAGGEVKTVAVEADRCVLSISGSERFAEFVRNLFDSGVPLDDFSVKDPSLESLFIQLTGKEWRD